jgi:hypothetical protein
MVGLQGQQVVAPGLQDPAGDGRLAAHGVQRHDAVPQGEPVQQLGNGRDLVGLVIRAALSQHEALLAGPGAHHVQRRPVPAAVERVPERLAVDGDHLALEAADQRADPGGEPGLEGVGVDQHEDAPEGVMRGDAVSAAPGRS